MSQAAYETFARGYITGFFDVVSAMLAVPVPNAIATVKPASPADTQSCAGKFNALLRAQIQSGGYIALLLRGADANRIFAGAMGQPAGEETSIAGKDAGELKEVFEPCLGGGVSYFKEKYGKVLVVQNPDVVAVTPELLGTVSQALGDDGIVAEFSYSLGDGHDGGGAFLFSALLSNVIPQPAPTTAQGGGAVSGSMSQDEVSAMLRDIGPVADTEADAIARPAAPARQADALETKNLDMVLDIRLTATARLGRVEMPISDILSLGPGSIVEVGHLVDEPVELLVNEKLIARGDVVVVDEKFGLRITEIVSPRERIESLR